MDVDLNGKCFLKLEENTTYLQKRAGEEVGGMHYKGCISYSEGHVLQTWSTSKWRFVSRSQERLMCLRDCLLSTSIGVYHIFTSLTSQTEISMATTTWNKQQSFINSGYFTIPNIFKIFHKLAVMKMAIKICQS